MPPKPDPKPPVTFSVAGATFTAHDGKIEGTFHPISKELWQAIIGFHRMVSIKWRAESVSCHKWSEREQRYHTIIPYQTTTKGGLSVRYPWGSLKNKELLDKYAEENGEDFFPCCTIHTHVNTEAFESGTDANDEHEMPGWHITLGCLLSKDEYDFDFRMRIPKSRRITEVVDTSGKFILKWNHLFLKEENIQTFIATTPGTKDWEAHLDKITAQ